jgi:enamine deaminase RidA (YjgF/YER057c/UK114 family)
MTTIAEKLQSLGHALRPGSAPVGSYVPTVRVGNLLFISGQISRIDDDHGVYGIAGADLSLDEARKGAEQAALNLLAQIAASTDGQITAIRRVVRLGVFVASAPDFHQQPQVANGASDLLVAVFGEAGRHTRTAVGTSALPRGVAVEVDAIIELEA